MEQGHSRPGTLPEHSSASYTRNGHSSESDKAALQITVFEAEIYDALSAYPFQFDPEFQAGLASIFESPANVSQNRLDLELQAKCFYFARKNNLPPIDPMTYLAHVSGATSTAEDLMKRTELAGQDGTVNHTHDKSLNPNAAPFTPTNIRSDTTSDATASTTLVTSTPGPEAQIEPLYPTSFAAIADLIARGQPIPGIEEIPDTVLEPGSSKADKSTKRRKPWEKDEEATDGTDGKESDESTNGNENTKSTGSENGAFNAATAVPQSALDTEEKGSNGVVHILKPDAVPESGLIAKEEPVT